MTVKPHIHEGVFTVEEVKEVVLLTKNMVPGEVVYNEERISVKNEDRSKIEYRIWNRSQSKLAAILDGVNNIWIKPGAKVLYLGAASGITVSHVSDIVGLEGVVYAVEIEQLRGRDLLNIAWKRTNIRPIIEDARHPVKYRMLLVDMVDVIFCDVAQPDQVRILALNASYFLKTGGHFVMCIKASCSDSTAPAETVFENKVKELEQEQFEMHERVTLLERYAGSHACVIGGYRVPNKKKKKKEASAG